MRSLRHRLGRFAVGFLVGALVLLPVTAHATPATTPDEVESAAAWKDKDDKKEEKAEKKEEKAEKAEKKEESPGNSGSAPGNSTESDDAPGNSANAPGQSQEGDVRVALPDEDDAAEAVVVVPAPIERPVAATPAPRPQVVAAPSTVGLGGFASVDLDHLPTHLSAAVMMFDQDEGAASPLAVPVTAQNGVSGNVIHTLAPVLPPALRSVVTSPIVVFEALIDAMASSGQALVIPLFAALFGFFSPSLRRRHSLDDAIGGGGDDPATQ
jgi:hypothetical protein